MSAMVVLGAQVLLWIWKASVVPEGWDTTLGDCQGGGLKACICTSQRVPMLGVVLKRRLGSAPAWCHWRTVGCFIHKLRF